MRCQTFFVSFLSAETLNSRIQSEQDFIEYHNSTLSNFNSEIIQSGVTSVIDAAAFTPFIFEERQRLIESNELSPKIYTVGKVVVSPQSEFSNIICQGSQWCEEHLLIEFDDSSNVGSELDSLVNLGADGIKIIYDSSFGESVRTYERISDSLAEKVIAYAKNTHLPVVSHTLANEEFKSLSLLDIDAFIHSPFPKNNSFDVDDIYLPELLVNLGISTSTTAHHFDPLSQPTNERTSFIVSVQNEIQPLIRKNLELGVNYTFGTDFSDFSRMSYSDVFQREVRALELLGFSNLEILQSLTLNAAKFPIITEDIGVIKTGYEADLLLFSKNPLQDLIYLST